MTGFARTEGAHDPFSWVWELKSVNSRGLDLRCRLPAGNDQLEPALKDLLAKRFKRGNITASLALVRQDGQAALKVNRDVLDQLIALQKELAGNVAAEPPRLEGLLAVRGVVEPAEEDETEEERKARVAALLAGLGAASEALAGARAAEGKRLTPALAGHLDEIAALVADAGTITATQPAALKARLKEQVAALLEADAGLPEERLAQEAAVLAAKADVREELDRLAAHVDSARELLAGDGAVGRRLDFLCQEFNREANTLCAKSADMELTRIGLALKAAVDQLREQVQNIE